MMMKMNQKIRQIIMNIVRLMFKEHVTLLDKVNTGEPARLDGSDTSTSN